MRILLRIAYWLVAIVLLAVMTAVVLLIVILHHCVWSQITLYGYHDSGKEIAPMLINPAFLGLILTALTIGDFFWATISSAFTVLI